MVSMNSTYHEDLSKAEDGFTKKSWIASIRNCSWLTFNFSRETLQEGES